MRRSVAVVVVSLVFAALPATAALATPSPNGPGQPNQDCEALQIEHAGFDTVGFANAESHYADPSILPHTANGHAVSQYDVACFQQFSH